MGALDQDDHRPTHPLRAIWLVIAGWSCILFFSVTSSMLSLLTLGRFSYWLTPYILRIWGRAMLWVQGVKVNVTGMDNYNFPASRVATFNHTSSLDAMIIPVVIPPGSTVAIKKEAIYVPLVGIAIYFMGFLFLNRGRSDRAKAVLARAGERMKTQKLTIFIAPEGTRSKNGQLQPFKRGAFHLAIAGNAVISPVVVVDSHRLHPRGCIFARKGTVHVHIMPSISTEGLTPEDIPTFAERLHEQYEKKLAELREEAAA